MGEVVFIGLGLSNEKGVSVEGLEAARYCNTVFAEFYTSILPDLEIESLRKAIGKEPLILSRTDLEDENGRKIVAAAQRGQVAFLVPGDPMIATTHVALRLELAKRGIPSRIIHGPSIISAVCGATGLQSYKFGKSTTLPGDPPVPQSVIDSVRENRLRNLHTLLLLEIRSGEKTQLTIGEAVKKLAQADTQLGDSVAVGVARVGCADEKVAARKAKKLDKVEFGRVPHSVVFPGKLHFMEAEALKTFCGAENEDLEGFL